MCPQVEGCRVELEKRKEKAQMKPTTLRPSINIGAGLVGLLLAVGILNSGMTAFTLPSSPQAPLNLPAEITLAESLTNADRAYLQDGLHLLRLYLPEWYAYVIDAKPFTLSIDPFAGERGLAADAKCCDAQGNGSITFGDHFGKLTTSNDADGQTREARQIEFLSTLVHEATHIRDQRSGLVPPGIDFLACITSERSAYGKELEFKRAMASIQISADIDLAKRYRRSIEKTIQVDAGAFNNGRLVLYCLPYAGMGD